MTLFEWLPLASVCLAGAASPGPSLAVVLAATMASGRPAGLAAAWAHAAGVGLYAALTVFGLSALITGVPALYSAIQIFGALYLLWIAASLLRSSGASVPDDATPRAAGTALRDGFAIAFLNPKLAVFMLALFSQFISADAAPAESAVLIATATLIDGLWYTTVVMAISRGNWLEALRANAALVNRIFGVLLSGLALYILALTILGTR